MKKIYDLLEKGLFAIKDCIDEDPLIAPTSMTILILTVYWLIILLFH